LSESITWAVTVGLAGPSGKVHLKLPGVLVCDSEPATIVPPVPQLSLSEFTVSLPGSVID
jgi:hypothetical protein